MNRYDDQFADSLSQPAFGEEPKRSWFGRNWFWFVPTLILLPVFCCCGGGGALVWWGVGQMKNLVPYADSVTAAEQDAAVQQALGTPITVTTVMGIPAGGEFDLSIDSSGQTFTAEIPLSGPTGSGTLHIESNSVDGVNWTYTIREVELTDGTVIDLIPAGSGGPNDADDSSDETIDAAVDVIERSLNEPVEEE